MKPIAFEKTDLKSCLRQARRERVVVVRRGRPVALIVGVEGMDAEQLELSSSDQFWKLVEKRRKQKVIGRGQLEKRLNGR